MTQIDKAREYTTVDTLTSWYSQDLLVVKEDIEKYKIQIPNPKTIIWNIPSYFADPYVNSNPRCPSNGVWDILYYGTYVTAVFLEGEIVLLRFWAKNRQPAFSRGIPFEISQDLVLTVSSLFSQRILENLELDCTPKFECNGARIADAMISSVSWTLH